MKIERLAADDIAPLAGLFQQFWSEKSSVEKMRKTFSSLAANPAYILLAAKQNDRLAGFAMGIICEELYGDCKPFMVIEDLIVDNTQQRKGVGSALMRELEKCAVDQNCCQIVFVTEAGRTQAHRFYESLGYESESYKGFKKKMKSGHQNSL